MQGLELSKRYYEEFGLPMMEEKFPELIGKAAFGLVGAGSECFGWDDEVSRNHDFEPGFCIFLPGEDVVDRRTAFKLERAYAALPDEYLGVKRLRISPAGGSRHGVIRAADFYKARTGHPDGIEDTEGWFAVPEHYLAEATNGEVFRDDEGSFTAVRRSLASMPPDVRLKKLAGRLMLMNQSGQYNYARCLAHGETGAAQLAAGEFVRNAMGAAFLLAGRYTPFYKWQFRALRALPVLSGIAPDLELLLTTPNDPETASHKQALIEETAAAVIDELTKQGLTKAVCGDLQKHAFSVNDLVGDAALRNADILYGVGE